MLKNSFMRKRVEIMKYFGLFLLLWIGGMNAWADIIYLHWKMDDSDGNIQYIYSSVPKCFYLYDGGPADETKTPYCVVYDMPAAIDVDNHICGDVSEAGECANGQTFYKNMDIFWESAEGGGTGCALGQAGTWAVALPIADTCVPFLFLAGIYGFIIYYRRNQRKPA
jgi:hypothetical protein